MGALFFKYLFFFFWTPQKAPWRYPPQPRVKLWFSWTVRVPNLHISPSEHLNTGLSPVWGGTCKDKDNKQTLSLQWHNNDWRSGTRVCINSILTKSDFSVFVQTIFGCHKNWVSNILFVLENPRRLYTNYDSTSGHQNNNFQDYYIQIKRMFGLLLRTKVIKTTHKYIKVDIIARIKN